MLRYSDAMKTKSWLGKRHRLAYLPKSYLKCLSSSCNVFADVYRCRHNTALAHCMNPWVWNGLRSEPSTGGEQNGAIIINLTAIIIINRWHWYHHGGGLEMIFSHQMLCNHFHQPFLHYHHPQVQALYHCHDLCITPANSWSTSRYAQVHPKMLQKRQSFHFWKISAHWAGLLGHPILSRQKVPRSQRLRQEKGSQRQSLNVGRSFCGK